MKRFISPYRSLGVTVVATALMVSVTACEKDSNNAEPHRSHTAAVEPDSTNKSSTPETLTSSSPDPTEHQQAAPNPAHSRPASPERSSNRSSASCDVEPQAPEILNNIGHIPPNEFG